MSNSVVLEERFLAWMYVSSVFLGGRSNNFPVEAVAPILLHGTKQQEPVRVLTDARARDNIQ